MRKYILNDESLNSNYFHFTDRKNLESIQPKGLIPNIGSHAKNIEKTRKIFFVEGLDNLLILFDCWINALYYVPVIPFIYKLGAFFLRHKWFPNMIGNSYFKILKVSKLHQKRAFRSLDKILNNGILLKLELEENVDFSCDDEDEIKSRGYIKKHLEICGYSEKYSNLDTTIMDKWNMHTFTDHKINSDKIKVCYLKNSSSNLRDIFNYCLENTKIDLNNICPELCAYLKYKGYIK